MACVDIPAFPLQLLLREHPGWRKEAVAVVESDRPQGKILWVNERARSRRILPGLRYAAALSLDGRLLAAEVPERQIARAVRVLSERLRRFTPEVEPAAREPGLFWLNASGLGLLFTSLGAWARLLHGDLQRQGFQASVVVGFSRFATAAVARATRGVTVFPDPGEERSLARRVPLDRWLLDPGTREALQRLGVETVGAFADLPPEGIESRFGAQAARLHRQARGEDGLFCPVTPPEPIREGFRLDYAERDATRLMARVDRLVPRLFQALAARGQALAEVVMDIHFEARGRRRESVVPAAPTLDRRQVRELIQLRVESIPLGAGVVALELWGRGAPAAPEQLALFADREPRDLEAANRALARVRAAFGPGAVVRAKLREGHLPEARFTWKPLRRLREAKPRPVKTGALVRRIEARPRPWPEGRNPAARRGRSRAGRNRGRKARWFGPYLVSGGWWVKPVHRAYFFRETRAGELLWVFYDRQRCRWFRQGRVE